MNNDKAFTNALLAEDATPSINADALLGIVMIRVKRHRRKRRFFKMALISLWLAGGMMFAGSKWIGYHYIISQNSSYGGFTSDRDIYRIGHSFLHDGSMVMLIAAILGSVLLLYNKSQTERA